MHLKLFSEVLSTVFSAASEQALQVKNLNLITQPGFQRPGAAMRAQRAEANTYTRSLLRQKLPRKSTADSRQIKTTLLRREAPPKSSSTFEIAFLNLICLANAENFLCLI
jgi:hypothetical protein